jgi:hypothetical protein
LVVSLARDFNPEIGPVLFWPQLVKDQDDKTGVFLDQAGQGAPRQADVLSGHTLGMLKSQGYLVGPIGIRVRDSANASVLRRILAGWQCLVVIFAAHVLILLFGDLNSWLLLLKVFAASLFFIFTLRAVFGLL